MDVNLAYYRKVDWGKLLSLVDDRENMHDTWEEWNVDYLKLKRELSLKGYVVNDFKVDLDELKMFCIEKGIRLDGKARSQFVQNK